MFDFGNANDGQRKAISTANGPVLITAGPGTGKTYTLVQRAICLIEECQVKPENLFIATFTEKAAKELITRITNELAARDAVPEILTINGAHALGYLIDPRGDFVVRVGSVVSPTTTEAFNKSGYARRRRLMEERDMIRDGILTEDEIFESRHYATCVIGGDLRGARSWRRPTSSDPKE